MRRDSGGGQAAAGTDGKAGEESWRALPRTTRAWLRRRGVIGGPLREQRFRRYFAGQALSRFGDSLIPVALAFAVLDLTGSATALGLVLLANRLPVVVLVLLGGVIGDRLSRRKVMITADVVRCAGQAMTAALLISGSADLWHLVALQAVAGVGTAFFTPAATGLLPATVGASRLQQANALLGLSRNTAGLLAQGISATLVATVGAGWAMAIDSATFAASAVSLAVLSVPHDAPLGPRPGVLAQLAGGWRHVRTRTWLWVTILHVSLLNALAISPFLVLGPLVAKRSLGGAPAWAAIATAYALGAIAGGVAALRVRPRRPLWAALLAVFALAPVLALLAVPAPAWAIAAAAVTAGAEGSFYNAVSTATTQAHVPADALSRVGSYITLGSLVAVPAGLALAGPLAAAIGVGATLWLSCAWVMLSTALTLMAPGVRNLPRTPEPRPATAASAAPTAPVI